jgi:carboxylesterase type B
MECMETSPLRGILSTGNRGEDAPYALVVWVHGESFEWNAGSSYDVSVLASLGHVIVVTLNYRLGVLGEFFFILFYVVPYESSDSNWNRTWPRP